MRGIPGLCFFLCLCVQSLAQSAVPALNSAYLGTLNVRMDRHGDLVVEQTDALGRLTRTTIPVQRLRTGDLTVEALTEGLQLTCSTPTERCLEREHFAQGATVRSSRMLLPWTTAVADQERTMALWTVLFEELRHGVDIGDLKP